MGGLSNLDFDSDVRSTSCISGDLCFIGVKVAEFRAAGVTQAGLATDDSWAGRYSGLPRGTGLAAEMVPERNAQFGARPGGPEQGTATGASDIVAGANADVSLGNDSCPDDGPVSSGGRSAPARAIDSFQVTRCNVVRSGAEAKWIRNRRHAGPAGRRYRLTIPRGVGAIEFWLSRLRDGSQGAAATDAPAEYRPWAAFTPGTARTCSSSQREMVQIDISICDSARPGTPTIRVRGAGIRGWSRSFWRRLTANFAGFCPCGLQASESARGCRVKFAAVCSLSRTAR